MWLCREVTSHSFPEIGDAFGGRDHTTVIHAVKTIDSCAARKNELNLTCLAASIERVRLSIKPEKLSVLCESSWVKPALWENYPDFIHRQSRDFSDGKTRFNYTEIKTILVIHRIVPDIVYKGI